jgi:alpha-beta hydrolase superfamily lysophospholipase
MFIEEFRDYVDDADTVWNWALQELSHLPSFIMGHSMGGCISTYLASRIINGGLGLTSQTDPSSLKGLILSAPAFEVGAAVSQVKVAAGRVINLLSPHTVIAGGLNRSNLSRVPGAAEAFASDPLCCEFNTVLLTPNSQCCAVVSSDAVHSGR